MGLPLAVDEDRLRALCREWKVSELSLFGSILRPDFSAGSDVDVLVRFLPGRTPTLFGLARLERELEGLFGRKVDLVLREAIDGSENYIRRENILASARVIYAA